MSLAIRTGLVKSIGELQFTKNKKSQQIRRPTDDY